MKILNVNMSLDPVTGGGTAERTYQMSRFLTRAGMECTILTTDLGLKAEQIRALQGVRVIALPCLLERFYVPQFSLGQIQDIVEKNDLVHIMGHWTLINALVYFVVAHFRKPYVVCPAGALRIYGRSRLLKTIYNQVVGRRIIRRANGHIAVTADEAFQFESYGVSPERVSIIPNGIEGEQYSFRDDEGFRKKFELSENPFFLFMGRLNSIKGPDLLLEAFCDLKDQRKGYHLVFAGPDEGLLSSLKEKALTSGSRQEVHFIGSLEGSEKSRAYHAAAAVVIPSRQEAMSLVVLEAGITGTPVIMTDQCGLNDLEQIAGLTIVPASLEGIKTGLVKFFRDPDGSRIMGENLKDFVEDHFSWSVIIPKYLNLFDSIIRKL